MTRNAVTVTLDAVACPVHGRIVPVDARGKLLGRCDLCVQEAEHGLLVLAEIARRKAEGDD